MAYLKLLIIFLITSAATMSSIVLSLADSDSNGPQSLLQGKWIWSDKSPDFLVGPEIDGTKSFSQLEFMPQSRVVGFTYLSKAFSKGGEALESGFGHYKLIGRSLRITAPPDDEIDGWPARGDTHPFKYNCKLYLRKDMKSFSLKECSLSGLWLKEITVDQN